MSRPKLKLGLNPTPEQERWLSEQFAKLPPKEKPVNPCIEIHGKGPDGVQCKTCKLLFAHICSKTYYKCGLRGFTRGPGTDHKVRWPACGKYQAR